MLRLHAVAAWTLLAALALSTSSRCQREPHDLQVAFEVRGTLTAEGIECPTLRSEAGVLYSLVGDLRGYKPGDPVCVKGRRADASICMQATTIVVEFIGPRGACP